MNDYKKRQYLEDQGENQFWQILRFGTVVIVCDLIALIIYYIVTV